MRKRAFAYLLLLLVAMPACRREPQPEAGTEGMVMLSMETKALPAGVETFRVAMFHNWQYTGRSGTYCTETFSYVDRYTNPDHPESYTWLQPCKVNDAGVPLDSYGATVVDVASADHDGSYGLRWNNGGSSGSSSVKLVAIAPAVQFIHSGHAAYLNWNIDDEVYISDPEAGGFSGIWFEGKYVYASSTSALSTTLVDHRAKVTVKIQCSTDLIPETYLYGVHVADRIVSDRFYLHAESDNQQGFSAPEDPEHPNIVEYFNVDRVNTLPLKNSAGLPDITEPATKNVHLVKGTTDWVSNTPFYLQARDYSERLMTGKRPVIVVALGQDPSNPVVVRVPLDQELLPMHHYLFTLDVTNTYIAVYFGMVEWDLPVLGGATETKTPAYLGSVVIGGPNTGDDVWENGGGGSAETPVKP